MTLTIKWLKTLKKIKDSLNKSCIMCDRPETEDNMIGCQNDNPTCKNWLHNSCDLEVKDDKTAKEIIDVYS